MATADMNQSSSSYIQKLILEVMDKAGAIGLTSKQLASKIEKTESEILNLLKILEQKNDITRIGRSLWIVTTYKDLQKDQLFVPPNYYTKKFQEMYNVKIVNYRKKITFSGNGSKIIHRWSPYVQGFSAQFVDDMLSRYQIRREQWVLDPFVGSGTVSVCAKMKGINSLGIDLMPLMTFMAKVKTRWNINISEVKNELIKVKSLWRERRKADPPFLRETTRQFQHDVLDSLLIIKKSILEIKNERIRDLFKLALASILVECSNLKRSPCLGYAKNKNVSKEAPFILFEEKVRQMIFDLSVVQKNVKNQGESEIILGDAKKINLCPEIFHIAITSPPYVNGMDYIINYKIEMAWLDLVRDYRDLYELKKHMVACDNIPKKVTRSFSSTTNSYEDEWLKDIVDRIEKRIKQKGNYRRDDMHIIVRKYFDDIYQIFSRVYDSLKEGGRFVVVIGDSLIAGIYIPADLILARMGKEIGFSIESVEKARQRRSGQRRDFILRECIVTLVKE